MYDIDFDPQLRRITSKASGFRTNEAAAKYGEDMKAALRKADRDFDLLIDLSEAIPVTTDAVTLFERVIQDIAASPFRKAAYVVASAIVRLQLGRILPKDPRFGVFKNHEEAETWLLATDPS